MDKRIFLVLFSIRYICLFLGPLLTIFVILEVNENEVDISYVWTAFVMAVIQFFLMVCFAIGNRRDLSKFLDDSTKCFSLWIYFPEVAVIIFLIWHAKISDVTAIVIVAIVASAIAMAIVLTLIAMWCATKKDSPYKNVERDNKINAFRGQPGQNATPIYHNNFSNYNNNHTKPFSNKQTLLQSSQPNTDYFIFDDATDKAVHNLGRGKSNLTPQGRIPSRYADNTNNDPSWYMMENNRPNNYPPFRDNSKDSRYYHTPPFDRHLQRQDYHHLQPPNHQSRQRDHEQQIAQKMQLKHNNDHRYQDYHHLPQQQQRQQPENLSHVKTTLGHTAPFENRRTDQAVFPYINPHSNRTTMPHRPATFGAPNLQNFSQSQSYAPLGVGRPESLLRPAPLDKMTGLNRSLAHPPTRGYQSYKNMPPDY